MQHPSQQDLNSGKDSRYSPVKETGNERIEWVTSSFSCELYLSVVVTSLWDENPLAVQEDLLASIVSGTPRVCSECLLIDTLERRNRLIILEHTRIVVPIQFDI